jgi:hypothetical protein
VQFFYGEIFSRRKNTGIQYLDGNEGGKTIVKSIGVHPSILHQWIKQYEIFGGVAFEKRYIFLLVIFSPIVTA